MTRAPQVGGKMAQIGSRLIDATAGQDHRGFLQGLRGAPAGAGRAGRWRAGPRPGAGRRRECAEPAGTLGWVLAAIVVLATLFFILR